MQGQGQQDGLDPAVEPWPFAASARLDASPGAALALISGLDLRVDPDSETPRQLSAQRRPGCVAALQPADVVLMTAGEAQAASVLPDLTSPAPRRWLRIQPQVGEDLLYHRPLQDGRDDLQLSGAAVRQCCMSMSKAKLQRRLTCTQVMS